ncbi:MAG TPA: response regulator transcription factor [Actinomycetota bacterium]|nr:response regulator transcription factor [Actinomycetota bacterium]
MVGMPEARLLVADDERTILDLLCASLRHAGFDVVPANDGREALELARSYKPDVLILDVMMPGYDGFEVVSRLRDEGLEAPVLFLTARDATEDKVRGLTVGGDDYVTKPFSLDEVLARIRALLRRTGRGPGPRGTPCLHIADLELDEDRHEVRRAGELVDLTPTEFKLLRLFMQNPNRVLSKSVILDRVWDYSFDGEASIVESYMSYLRRKVDIGQPRLLHTLRGVGYVLKVPS